MKYVEKYYLLVRVIGFDKSYDIFYRIFMCLCLVFFLVLMNLDFVILFFICLGLVCFKFFMVVLVLNVFLFDILDCFKVLFLFEKFGVDFEVFLCILLYF